MKTNSTSLYHLIRQLSPSEKRYFQLFSQRHSAGAKTEQVTLFQEINKNPQFIREILDNKDFPSIEKFKAQVKMEIEKGTIKIIKAEQLFINLMALNVFPFIAAPLIKGVLKMDDKTFKQMMEDRKTEVGDFIINSIKK